MSGTMDLLDLRTYVCPIVQSLLNYLGLFAKGHASSLRFIF